MDLFDRLTSKRCPKCGGACEKYVMFRNDWYWRCPVCRIDADSYSTPSQINIPKVRAWDDEQEDTQPNFKMVTYHELRADDCAMSTFSITTDPFSGTVRADVNIVAIGRTNGIPTSFTFQETFDPQPGFRGQDEDEYWEQIAIKVLGLNFSLNVLDVKAQYLRDRLGRRHPSDKVKVTT